VQQTGRSFGSIKVKLPVAAQGQRVGIMGGSFNPPHDGHRIVAETALRRLQLDQLWWVVTPGNPLKSNGALPSQADRMTACKAFAHGRRMRITGFEAELGSPYTAVTVEFLKRRCPDVDFVWVMGADNLASFHRWQNWRQIAAQVPLAVVDRPEWRLKALASPAGQKLAPTRFPETLAATLPGCTPPAWTLLTTRLSSLSSTAIRSNKLITKKKIKSS
jgi:nicotinate-nucleotide adenylyltransferase